MLTHKQVWNAIDTIAERYGFSASGLAKKSGLDPTSFNPSKRNGPDGRPRWPTMESISRLLQASGASMEEFSDLLIGRRGQPPRLRQIPLLGLAKAGKGGFFDDSGFPS
ncbi:MAG: helix-turn-helix transcriptional regulator, partial [Alphaproteobacteria bacterium]|nr:helix-turn-helix transcriptional regulator [Alphaproteobacteria bacterium]